MEILEKLKDFARVLESTNRSPSDKLKIINYLKTIEPDENLVLASGILTAIEKFSKQTNEISVQSRVVIRKWKAIFRDKNIKSRTLDYNQDNVNLSNISLKESQQRKFLPPLNTTQNSVKPKTSRVLEEPSRNRVDPSNIRIKDKSTRTKRKISQDDEESCKKVKLSLNDYYKKRNIEMPTSSNMDSTQDMDNTLNPNVDFMHSLMVKVEQKPKTKASVSTRDIRKLASNSQRLQSLIPRESTQINNNETSVPENNYDCCTRIEQNRRLWKPKPKNPPKPTSILLEDNYFSSDITTVPSLLQQCQDVLLAYRNHIDEVYNVPRFLLEHILSKYTSEELLRFESHNKQYIKENALLWKLHFENEFPKFFGNKNSSVSWRKSFILAKDDQKLSFTRLKNRLEKDRNERPQLKVLKCEPMRRNKYQIKRRPFQSYQPSPYSKPTQKVMQQYKSYYSQMKR